MTYYAIALELEHLDMFWDLRQPIEIVLAFVTKFEDKLEGFNFNKYYDPERGQIHPHLTIRLNSKGELQRDTILQFIDQLKRDNKIRYFDGQFKSGLNPISL